MLAAANRRLETMWAQIREPDSTPCRGPVRVGVDLGTSTVVVAVLDQDGEPVAGAMRPARVVRDGLVMDYMGAVRVVRQLVGELEDRLGRRLTHAACAIPPGTGAGADRITRNVVEAAGLTATGVYDEPTAAAAFLGIENGAVIDVGGGTTGISVLRDGQVVYTADEPTGGTHFTLVLAGHYGISFEEAEALKCGGLPASEVFPVVRPVAEKVASIARRHLAHWDIQEAYLVGGAAALDGMARVLESHLEVPVLIPAYPILVTPMGIAQLTEPHGGDAA